MFGNGSAAAVAAEKPSIHEGEALQERGLQLALFIIGDRGVALEILSNALNKLQIQRSREAKRKYWRRRYLKRKITRMVRNDSDALQWLIYFEAEGYEKQEELAGKQTECDMVIRYLKHLVQVTTAMSSFYVSVGMNRLMRNYSTPEVRQLYEWVTQHFPSDQEYRKVKGDLMAKLKLRFGSFLKASAGQYGELRFEALEDQAPWTDLVRECLKVFTPWSTDQACQSLSSAGCRLPSLPQDLHIKAQSSGEEDILEVHRCHVFLDPTCYSHVTGALGLESAEKRLSLPRFFMTGGSGGTSHSRKSPMPEGLTEQEQRRIRERLSVEAERRRRVKPKFLRILVDGRECTCVINGPGSNSRCHLQEGANLIEIWTDYEGEDLLLATHWIEYTQSQGIASAAATVDLGDGRELLLEIKPEKKDDDASYAVLSLESRPVGTSAWMRELLPGREFWFHRFPQYAFASLLILGIGWSIARVHLNHQLSSQRESIERLGKELAQERDARASLEKKLQSEQQAGTVEAYLLMPDESDQGHGRDAGGTPEPNIAFSPKVGEVILELPAPGNSEAPYRAVLRPFLEHREILAEDFPISASYGESARLKFVLPMAFVQPGKHYVIELNSIRHSERIHTFTFYVAQK